MAGPRDDLEDMIREHVYPAVRGEDDVEGVGDAVDAMLANPKVVLAVLEAKLGIGGIFELFGWTMYPAEQDADGEWGWPYAVPDGEAALDG